MDFFFSVGLEGGDTVDPGQSRPGRKYHVNSSRRGALKNERHGFDRSFIARQTAQVELSVKHAFGIPVARDSRMGDIRQRGMRACLFYDTGREVDK